MTQLFAGDEQIDDRLGRHLDKPFDQALDPALDPAGGRLTPGWPMIRQRPPGDDRPSTAPGSGGLGDFGPALTAGKGVRAVRCVGCSEPTLPRTDDNAPLCARCSDLLDGSQQRSSSLFSGRWRRRR